MRWIASGLAGRGWSVRIATLARSLDADAILQLQRECPGVEVCAFDNPFGEHQPSYSVLGIASNEWRAWRLMREFFLQSSKSSVSDVVLVPYLDYCSHVVALLGSPFKRTPWVGIAMRPTFHYATMGIDAPPTRLGIVRTLLFRLLLRTRSLRRCLTIDEPLAMYANVKWPASTGKLRYLADPVQAMKLEPRAEARRKLGIPTDAKLVLAYGWITGRKGIGCLIDALVCSATSATTHALIVGKLDDIVRETLRSPQALTLIRQQRLHVFDGWADEPTEAAAFSAADVVWLGYEGHWQSSGVLIQACQAGLPVIACDKGIIGWFTRKHKIGLAVAVRDPHAVATAINDLVHEQVTELKMRTAGWTDLAERHSIKAALNTIESALS